MNNAIIGGVIGFLISIIIGLPMIKLLTRIKFGQEIREEGPKWHKSKSGTPTMGGLIFIISAFIVMIAFLIKDFKSMMLLYLSLSFGFIGFMDDYIKVVKKRNLGLSSMQKLIMQIVVSIVFVIILYNSGLLATKLIIPFSTIELNFNIWFFIPFSVFVIISIVNAVNLTDGIDGLASSITFIVLMTLGLIFWKMGQVENVLFTGILAGSLLGFLMFNKYPARVFMGDTGSLFLGGALSAIVVAEGLSLVLLIFGAVYIIEIASVVLQVASFKLTGKRIFKMSPIHHHFEMCGWSEKKIVYVFSTLSAIVGVIAYLSVTIMY